MAIFINTYYDEFELLSFTPNSIVLKVSKSAEYDTSDRNYIQTSEDTIIKINLSDDENEEVILNQLINKDNDIIRKITTLDIPEITNYSAALVGKVNVESLINRIDRSRITEEHRDILRKIPGANQEKLVIFYKMREYSSVDHNGNNIYTRYKNAAGGFNLELFVKDFISITTGLNKLHSSHLAHHDIKPSSLMFSILGNYEAIKLTDLESSVAMNSSNKPALDNIGEADVKYAYAKRMLKHSKYHQNIKALYDVDRLELIMARARNINHDISDLSLNSNCDLVKADLFSLGMTMLDILMYENQTCNFNTFVSILENRHSDVSREYVKEAVVIDEIIDIMTNRNERTLTQNYGAKFYDQYLSKFSFNGVYNSIALIICDLLNNEYDYELLTIDLENLIIPIPADLPGYINRNLPEIYSRYVATYSVKRLKEDLEYLLTKFTYNEVFNKFKTALGLAIHEFLDDPTSNREFRRLQQVNFKENFLSIITNIDEHNRQYGRTNIYNKIIEDVNIQLYFAYLAVKERR